MEAESPSGRLLADHMSVTIAGIAHRSIICSLQHACPKRFTDRTWSAPGRLIVVENLNPCLAGRVHRTRD